SLPRVKGTTQNEHILSQPRVIEIKADIPLLPSRTGLISAYVSSLDNKTFTALCPDSTEEMRFGRSRYESGPTTMSTNFSCSSSFDFNRSAMQPSTPIMSDGLWCFFFLKSLRRAQMRSSALSRMAQVLRKIT